MRRQRILVVGSGGREHALVWKLAQSPDVECILAAPGNAGTSQLAENLPIAATDVQALADLAEARDIDLTVVGPEAPLALGLADLLCSRRRAVFGPDEAGARLEAHKGFAKEIMRAAGVPTADYRVFGRFEAARAHLATARYPLVVKADGLAAGKGVVVCESEHGARETLESFMLDRLHGDAGECVVIEDALQGPEVSLLALVDGRKIVPLPIAQDHKRLGNGNRGPNTGGMGAYAPVPFLDREDRARLIDLMMRPVVELMSHMGTPYRGVLYAGLMLTPDGPRVLEFNCRFGDPEAQVILPLLADDLLPWLTAVAQGALNGLPPALEITGRSAVGVVVAAPGYPEAPQLGSPINGIEDTPEDVLVFHAGTSSDWEGQPIVAGGRVLTVVGTGDTLEAARQRAYSAPIDFPWMQVRTDIARPWWNHRPRIGVLASGDGSNLQALLDASVSGKLDAEIALVVSSNPAARSLEHARHHGVPALALPFPHPCDYTARREYDRRLLTHLLPFELDLLVLAGWMHLLSPEFLEACPCPIINVHPALLSGDSSAEVEMGGHSLPVLRGTRAVRRALTLELPFTGVTIHHVTEAVDSGPIILREPVLIQSNDCEDTLYGRIKSVEHRLLVQAISLFLSSAHTGVAHASNHG